MRLGDDYLGCIVYLGWPIAGTDDEIDAVGTGFLVAHDGAHYVVTAAHVALRFSRDSLPFGIRLNKVPNTGGVDRIDGAKWYFHPDDKIDVAVLPYVPPSWAAVKVFPTRHVISDFKRETKNIGPGDQAYVVGIFKLLPGVKRNNPVVHTGHVASTAEGEEIETLDWRSPAGSPPTLKIQGYIIQVHTMPQASGSPVFVRRSLLGYTRFTPHVDEKKEHSEWCPGSTAAFGSWVSGMARGPTMSENTFILPRIQ